MRLSAKWIVLALLVTAACGGDGLYTVSGTVTQVDAQGNKTPLAGVVVALQGSRITEIPTEPIVYTTTGTTDANGHYAIHTSSGANTTSGVYKLSALTAGYSVTPAEYDLSNIHGDLGGQDFVAVAQ
jgi:hypothetical protein